MLIKSDALREIEILREQLQTFHLHHSFGLLLHRPKTSDFTPGEIVVISTSTHNCLLID